MDSTLEKEFYIKLSSHDSIEETDYLTKNNTSKYNHLIFVEKGVCYITSGKKHLRLSDHSILYIARNVTYQLQVIEPVKCLFHIFVLERTTNSLHADLKKLSLECPIVNDFFSQKDHLCQLIDCERSYITLNELAQEYDDNNDLERERVLNHLLSMLYIKLARSFHLHGKPSGITYISSAKFYIAENYEHELTVQMIADHVGISRSYLETIFLKYAKRTLTTHVNTVRVNRAAYLLTTTQIPITDIAFQVGYNNRQHFSRIFSAHYSCSPQDYRSRYSNFI
jgi:AraC-like DNA-binding protein